jgi:hypothetical protein
VAASWQPGSKRAAVHPPLRLNGGFLASHFSDGGRCGRPRRAGSKVV